MKIKLGDTKAERRAWCDANLDGFERVFVIFPRHIGEGDYAFLQYVYRNRRADSFAVKHYINGGVGFLHFLAFRLLDVRTEYTTNGF